MTAEALLIAIAIGLFVNEGCELSPWCARKLVRWAAFRRYSNRARAEARAEEWCALINDRPGKLFKLVTDLCFVFGATVVSTRRALGRLAGGHLGIGRSNLPDGFAALDFLTNVRHPGQVVAVSNSTMAFDLYRSAAVKRGVTSVFFSYEMSRNELTMRLLSAESGVPLHAMRTGQMGEDDWTRLASRMSQLVDAPLFIDDSPNISILEIISKCRRLKLNHNLKLVTIDNPSLFSRKRVDRRQASRSLKLLAKELDVRVVYCRPTGKIAEIRRRWQIAEIRRRRQIAKIRPRWEQAEHSPCVHENHDREFYLGGSKTRQYDPGSDTGDYVCLN